jgi:hypothetical protein
MTWGCRGDQYPILNDSNDTIVLSIMILPLVGNRLSPYVNKLKCLIISGLYTALRFLDRLIQALIIR